MVRQYFNLDEAEELIPSISPLLRRARQLKQELDTYEFVVERNLSSDGEESLLDLIGNEPDAEFHDLRENFYRIIETIESRGGLVRNIDEGLIDFYSRFEGREIFLTWQVGDRRIRHWHDIDEDVWNRKEIVDLRFASDNCK